MESLDQHLLPLFRFAYRLTGSVADAEDIVQECFLGLLNPKSSYDPKRTPLRTYLFGAVRNQALKRLQRREPAVAATDVVDVRSPEFQALRTELEDVVARAVAHLPGSQREVLILAHYEQMPLSEIAEVLSIEVAAVKSRLQRARAALKEILAPYARGVENKP